MLVRDAYHQRRAWSSWSTGLVAAGAIKEFDQLMPKLDTSEQDTAAAMAALRARLGIKSEFVPYADE